VCCRFLRLLRYAQLAPKKKQIGIEQLTVFSAQLDEHLDGEDVDEEPNPICD